MDNPINNLPYSYREDVFVQVLFDSILQELTSVQNDIETVKEQNFFNTLTVSLDDLVKRLALIKGSTCEDVEAKWKSNIDSSISEVQKICDSSLPNEIEVKYESPYFIINFINSYGPQEGLSTLASRISESTPCHLGIKHKLKFLKIKDIHRVFTINTLNSTKINNFKYSYSEEL